MITSLKKLNVSLFLSIILICASCSPLPSTLKLPLPIEPTTAPTQTKTPFPSSIPSIVAIDTPMPTLNPRLVKVLTATSDLNYLVTATPSKPQLCPDVDANVTPDIVKDIYLIPPDYSYSDAILGYLNSGGSPIILQNYLSLGSRKWVERDLTGDGIPELLVAILGYNIFMCEGRGYTNPMSLPLMADPDDVRIAAIDDMNQNGIPELILTDGAFSAGMYLYRIYEWDGHEFQSLIWPDTELMGWYATHKGRALDWYDNRAPNNLWWENSFRGIASSVSIADLDSNGTKELVVHNQMPPVRHRGYSPWRNTTDIYTWNGLIFMLDEIQIEPPVYRFQAVQDADRLSLLGDYSEALKLYQAVILDDSLFAWSEQNYRQQLDAEGQRTPTPTPIAHDEEEYRNLAAYARYRIMLLQILQNDLESARAAFETLQDDFPYGSPGHHFSVLAYVFWQEFKSSLDVDKACSKAVRYAEGHKTDIFINIGNSSGD